MNQGDAKRSRKARGLVAQSHNDQVPAALLTGLPGAGKTTLLNRLICDPEPERIAAVMDALGDEGLDHDPITPQYRMDGIVALIHAANGPHTLNAQFEAATQLATADPPPSSESDGVLPRLQGAEYG